MISTIIMYGSRCHSVRRYRPRHRPHCVRWGPSSTPTGHSPLPRFSAHVCGDQTAGWIKMPLGTKVGLGAGHIVLCGDPAPPPRDTAPCPDFRPMSVVAKRLDGSRCHLIRRLASAQVTLCYVGTQPPTKRGTPPTLGLCLVAKRSPISATAEHLFFWLRQ